MILFNNPKKLEEKPFEKNIKKVVSVRKTEEKLKD